MQTIQQWLAKYHISTHILAVIAFALTAGFEGYKPFHDLVLQTYNSFPAAAQALIGLAGFLYALYKKGGFNLPAEQAGKVAIDFKGKITGLVLPWCLPVGLGLLAFSGCMVLTGCASLPAWLAGAGQLLPIFSAGAGTILSIIGTLLGQPELAAAAAALTAIASAAQKAIADVQAMVQEYQTHPSTGLLSQIEEGIQAVTDNLEKLLEDVGLPEALASPITHLAQLLLEEFEAWASTISVLKAVHGDKVTLTIPMTADQFKDAFNKILTTPTGDPLVDSRLAHVKHL